MGCKRCNNEPVFRLVSGVGLCKSCFTRYFEGKVRKTIRQHKLVGKNERIAVAVSGGKDSTVALEMLKMLSLNSRNIELFAILIDEGIRGYRPKTIKNARAYCKKNNIPLYIYSYKEEFGLTLDQMVRKLKLKPCSICGALRRHLLNKYARKLKATKLATGHNCDDEAQSILMNMLKGSNAASARLGPVTGVVKDSKFVPRIKPLYNMLEKEVTAYAYLKGLLDNFLECKYASLAYRNQVRDTLNSFEEKHPGTKNAVISSFIEILPLLKKNYKSNEGIAYCKACKEPASNEVCKACSLLKELKSKTRKAAKK